MINVQHLSQKNIVIKNDIKKPVLIDTSSSTTPLAINNNNDSQNQNITTPATADTNLVATVSSALMQKKLKVVHVNELGEPVEFNADIAHSTDLYLFQLKLVQQEIYNASTIASNNSSVLSFKPKNFPN